MRRVFAVLLAGLALAAALLTGGASSVPLSCGTWRPRGASGPSCRPSTSGRSCSSGDLRYAHADVRRWTARQVHAPALISTPETRRAPAARTSRTC